MLLTLGRSGEDNLNTGREGCELRFYFWKDSIGNLKGRTDIARCDEEERMEKKNKDFVAE